MPVKLWARDDHGRYTSTIRTSRSTILGGEEFRVEAEELDAHIDTVLDRAVQLSSSPDERRKSRDL